MDQHRFDTVARALTRLPTRRDVLRGLAGAGVVLGSLSLSEIAAAKQKAKGKKKKKKHKTQKTSQPAINQYGCAEVGQPCFGDHTICCSGLCEGVPPKKGKPDTRVCAAHGAGTCDQAAPGLCQSPGIEQTICNNSTTCLCLRTTAGSNFCGAIELSVSGCAACQRDRDCEALGFVPGSACVPFATGTCAGNCATGMVCAAPCGTVPTEPVE